MTAAGHARAVIVALVGIIGLCAGAAHGDTRYAVSTIPIRGVSSTLVIDSVAHRGYAVINATTPGVQVFNTRSKRPAGLIPIRDLTGPLAVDPARHRLYAVQGGTILAIDTRTRSVIRRLESGVTPFRMAVDPRSHKVYVLGGGDVLTVIDPAAPDAPLNTIPLPGPAGAIAVDGRSHRVYVGHAFESAGVTAVDTRTDTVIRTFAVPGLIPLDLAVDSATDRLFVVDGTDQVIRVLDTADGHLVGSMVDPNPGPSTIVLDPGHQLAYVNHRVPPLALTVFDTQGYSPLTTIDHLPPSSVLGIDTGTRDVFIPGFLGVAVVTPTGGLAPQTIFVVPALPERATVGQTVQVSVSGGASGNPVTVAVDATTTGDACTATRTGSSTFTVTYQHAGTCVITADQAGSQNFEAAPQVRQSTVVKRVRAA